MVYKHISTQASYIDGTFTLPCDLSKSRQVGRETEYHKKICSFFMVADTETSHNAGLKSSEKADDFDCWSYQQACALFDSDNGILLEYNESRSIRELCFNFLNFDIQVSRRNSLGIIFFHNSKFDIRFFRRTLIGIFEAKYGASDDLYKDFMIDPKTWLYFRIHNIEIRCSWRLTQQSLYSFTKDMAVQHRKLLNANDYGIHYSDEDLPQEYHDYMYNDVVGLGESICQMLKLEKLTLANVPYTGTGFPRNDVKSEFIKNRKALYNFVRERPSISEYRIWQRSYAGGHTQCNELYREKEVHSTKEKKIKHRDFVSFYPSLIYTMPYPVGKGKCLDLPTLDEFFHYPELVQLWEDKLKEFAYNDKLYMMRLLVIGYAVNDGVMPFIPCSHIDDDVIKMQPTYYSNKLKLYNGSFVINVTTPDLRMIYEYSKVIHIIPLEIYEYAGGRMPQPILNVVKKYFVNKSELKYEEKAAVDTPAYTEIHSKYQRSKGKLNGIYGMLVERLIKYDVIWDEDILDFVEEKDKLNTMPKYLRSDVIEKALEDYYGTPKELGNCKRGKCLSYAHGCYVTAWARYYLYAFCDTIHWDNVLYTDTDSAFYLSDDEVEERIAALNAELREEAEFAEAFADVTLKDGTVKRVYLHEFALEDEDIVRFKALNAKRYMYAYLDSKGKMHLSLTCAGIAKGIGLHENEKGEAVYSYTREMEICGMEQPGEITPADIDKAFKNFKATKKNDRKNAFVFKQCGGTTTAYTTCKPGFVTIDGHKEWTEGGVAILGSEKALIYVEDKGSDEYIASLKLFELAAEVATHRLTSMEEKL